MLCVDNPEPMVRKRSVVWRFFKTVDSQSVQCLLCRCYLVRHSQGTTTSMLKHLRVNHPTEVVQIIKRRVRETTSINSHQDVEMDSEQFCSVEVALEDGDSDINTTGNETDINSAINSMLKASGPAEQITSEYASDDPLVRRRRNKRSSIWRHFERLDSLDAVRCRTCMKKLQCGSTSNLRRHMSTRHPVMFSQLVVVRKNPPPSHSSSQGSNANDDTSTPPEAVGGATEKRPVSVEVTLEDGDSDINTTGNETDINSAINSMLKASGPAEQITSEYASDDPLVRRRRNKRSSIWRHYERLDSLDAARCRICMKKLQCYDSGSTSNLHRHMSKRHPQVFSQLVVVRKNPPPSHSSSQGSNANGDTSTPPEAVGGATEKRPVSGALKVSQASEGEKRLFRRERELIEALRRAQREEAQALEHQRELLQKLHAVNAREAAAEREHIESLRKAQVEEAAELSRQKEELQREKAELEKKWEELQQERLVLFPRGQQAS